MRIIQNTNPKPLPILRQDCALTIRSKLCAGARMHKPVQVVAAGLIKLELVLNQEAADLLIKPHSTPRAGGIIAIDWLHVDGGDTELFRTAEAVQHSGLV